MKITQRITWTLVTLIMFVANGLAIGLPLNGRSTASLSDTLSTVISPAGFTFSIWSVIYLAIIIITAGVIIGKVSVPTRTHMRYVTSCLANAAWIFAWHYGNLHLSLLIMLILLGSLIMVDRSMKGKEKNIPYYSWIRTGFLTYLGWVSMASLLNTTIYFQYQIPLIAQFTVIAGVIGLIIAGSINLIVLGKEKHIATSLVAVWALRGISQATSVPTIMTSSLTIGGILLIGIGYTLYASSTMQYSSSQPNQLRTDKR